MKISLQEKVTIVTALNFRKNDLEHTIKKERGLVNSTIQEWLKTVDLLEKIICGGELEDED